MRALISVLFAFVIAPSLAYSQSSLIRQIDDLTGEAAKQAGRNLDTPPVPKNIPGQSPNVPKVGQVKPPVNPVMGKLPKAPVNPVMGKLPDPPQAPKLQTPPPKAPANPIIGKLPDPPRAPKLQNAPPPKAPANPIIGRLPDPPQRLNPVNKPLPPTPKVASAIPNPPQRVFGRANKNGKVAVSDIRMTTNPNAAKVYDGQLVKTVDFNKFEHQLSSKAFEFSQESGRKLVKPGTQIGNLKIGKRLGQGGVSTVYKVAGDNSKVVKIVPLRQMSNGFDGREQILDQAIGRKILNDLKDTSANSDIFDVAKQSELKVIRDESGEMFAVSVEQNISKPIFDPVKKTWLTNPDGSKKMASNAAERLNERGVRNLTSKEELTINIAIRDLNKRGIVWTDNKLENFDIVPDSLSKTGYKVMFFDFDAFRPVKGANAAERFTLARRMQRVLDSNDGGADYSKKMGKIVSDYSAQHKAFRSNDLYDLTGFPFNMATGKTPRVNLQRGQMRVFNEMDETQFAKAVQDSYKISPGWKQTSKLQRAKTVGKWVAGGTVGAVAILGISTGVAYAIDPAGVAQFFSEPVDTIEQRLSGL